MRRPLDLAKARAFAASTLRPYDDMTWQWITNLADEVEGLRRRVDELRGPAAHGVRNPPEVIQELRDRIDELEPFLAVVPCPNPSEHEELARLLRPLLDEVPADGEIHRRDQSVPVWCVRCPDCGNMIGHPSFGEAAGREGVASWLPFHRIRCQGKRS